MTAGGAWLDPMAIARSQSEIVAMQGSIKWFNRIKGFGFIVPEEGGADVFVHASALEDPTAIVDGVKVEYEETEGRKGKEAANVRVVEG